jgi:transposase
LASRINSSSNEAQISKDLSGLHDPSDPHSHNDCQAFQTEDEINYSDHDLLVELEPLRVKITNLNAENVKLKTLVVELKAELKELKAQNSKLKPRNAKLEAQVVAQKAEKKELKIYTKKLEVALGKAQKTIDSQRLKLGMPKANSKNTSMPGSKDMRDYKKKNKSDDGENQPKRKIGGQKGHKPYLRKKLVANEVKEYEPEATKCTNPNCGGNLVRDPEKDSVVQQIEIPTPPPIVTDHIARAYRCEDCGKVHSGQIPEEIKKQGLLGVSLLALIVCLKVAGASFRNIQNHLSRWYGVVTSIGWLSNSYIKAGKSLTEPCEEIKEKIKEQPVLNIDETTHKNNGKRFYNWVFVSAVAILFKIGSRARDMLDIILGPDYKGLIGSDFYNVYLSYAADNPGVTLQTCLAHLKRDFKYCKDHLDPDIHNYGEKMLGLLGELFEAWRAYKDDMSPENYEKLRSCGDIFNEEGGIAPNKGKARIIANRFTKVSPGSYTTFIEHPEIEPTNNSAERAVRQVVMQRHVTQGTRSMRGIEAHERIWSAKATCEVIDKDFVNYLKSCITAQNKGERPPSIFE